MAKLPPWKACDTMLFQLAVHIMNVWTMSTTLNDLQYRYQKLARMGIPEEGDLMVRACEVTRGLERAIT